LAVVPSVGVMDDRAIKTDALSPSSQTNIVGTGKGSAGQRITAEGYKMGQFEEEVSGINLSKLFSVYGPQSAEGKKRTRITS
jgi:hypothetical protein